MTYTLANAQWADGIIVDSLLDACALISSVPGAPDKDEDWSALTSMSLYEGVRICLTVNRDKDNTYVNGMGAHVICIEGSGILVRTDAGIHLTVYKTTDRFKRSFFPIRYM